MRIGKDIGVRGEVLTELPSALKLTLMPPPRAKISKTNSNIIKEPIFAIESSIVTISIGSAIRIN